MEPTFFPDAEALVVTYLNVALAARGDAARATTRVPGVRPDRLVRVTLTGSSRRGLAHLDAQVTIECWDTDSVAAIGLTQVVYALMCALDTSGAHVPQGGDGWVGGPVYLEDPEAQVPRYVMTAIVRTRALTLEDA